MCKGFPLGDNSNQEQQEGHSLKMSPTGLREGGGEYKDGGCHRKGIRRKERKKKRGKRGEKKKKKKRIKRKKKVVSTKFSKTEGEWKDCAPHLPSRQSLPAGPRP